MASELANAPQAKRVILNISKNGAKAWRFCSVFFALSIFYISPLCAQNTAPPAAILLTFDTEKTATIAIQGLSNRTTGRALMPDDPVRIASISKFFVGLAVMRLVDRNQLQLDQDVSDYLGWSLRHPDYPDISITLRLLLSHQSGLRDGINYALPMDSELESVLKDPAAWDQKHAPGGYFAYANLNFPVIAAIMEAVTGARFDQIMETEIFAPLQFDACFNWTLCSDQKISAAVTLYRANGNVARDDLRGVREPCPLVPARDGSCDTNRYQLGKTGSIFSPQGGLRISARDLAKIGQILLKNDETFLSKSALGTMTHPAWQYDGKNGESENGYFCAYGLAVHILAIPGRPATCRDDPFGDNKIRFGHSGEAYALKSGFWINPQSRSGTVFYRTAIPENDLSGHCIYFCE